MDGARLRAFGPGPSSGYDLAAPVPRSSARVERGAIHHLEAHLERLGRSAAAAGTDAPWLGAQGDAIRAWVMDETAGGIEALRLRLHGGQVWALLEPLPGTPIPYRLALMEHPFDPAHPLAPHKGLLGTWNLEALARAQALGAEDALLRRADGTLVETAIASVAWEVDGEVRIPEPGGRIASLAERLDLPAWAGARPIRPAAFRAEDLVRGQLWCFNAVRGIWPAALL